MIALSTAASWMRICFCWWGGNTAMMRLIVSVASRVWRVEKHEVAGLGGEQGGLDRLVVAHLADQDDVRVLPQAPSAAPPTKLRVSTSTSRWLMIAFLSRCRNSIGSSIVTMWQFRVLLMWSIIAASVVDLPDPVVPVTSTRPRSSSAIRSSTGGSSSSRMARMRAGISRSTRPTEPRCWKMLQRKRPSPGTEYAMSISRNCLNFSFCWVDIIENAMAMVSSCIRRLNSTSGTSVAVHADDRVRTHLEVHVGRLALRRRLQNVVDVHGTFPPVARPRHPSRGDHYHFNC